MIPKMDNFVEQYCRLCLCAKSNENFEKISSFTMGSLDILLLKLDLDQNKHVICKVCALKVEEALKFKSMCLCTDNIIISHIDDETGSSVDLIEIYAEEKGKELTIYDLYGHKVCRLCMQLIEGKFISVHEVNIEAIEKYIPEINLSIIKDPVVCQQCFDSIRTHSSFLKNCIKVEEKIKSFYDSKGSLSSYQILSPVLCVKVEHSIVKQGETENGECLKSESIMVQALNTKAEDSIIKLEDGEDSNGCMENKFNIEILENDNGYEIKTECIDLKSEECESDTIPRSSPTLKTVSETQIHNCDLETISKSELEDHITDFHRNIPLDPEKNSKIEHVPSKDKLFHCDKCSFVGKYRSYLTRHQLKHKDHSQVQTMYKCDKCDLKTKYKSHIKIHQLTHANPSVEEMYKCDKCSFASKYKGSFKMHQLIHEDTSQVRFYKCDKCSYESKFRNRLKAHQIVHKPPSQVQMFKCGKCDFESKRKADVKIHESRHVNSSGEKTYSCEKCSYASACKRDLKAHQTIHEKPSQLYKCNECSFESRFRGSFRRHQLRRHTDSLQAGPAHKCDKGSYETKVKDHVEDHQLKHTNLSKECENQ